MKVALVHDWLTGMRGGEKCLEVLSELFPEAVIFTLLHSHGSVARIIEDKEIRTSFLQHCPGIHSYYRYYLPLFPQAIESFDLKGFDLVISTSHCVAKGIKPGKGAAHLCYCFTPMRYAWLFFDEYFGSYPALKKALIRPLLNSLRQWDLQANSRVNHFMAISRHVQERIQRFYQREAQVIYPPVDVSFYTEDRSVRREDFYLIVSALVPYKKVDTAIEASNKGKFKLVIIGSGTECAALQKLSGSQVTFLGWQPDEAIRDYYRRCRALLFPGEEDFGIVPVEAQGCGAPVIAFRKGGALETVSENETGIFFDRADAGSLLEAVRRFERLTFDSSRLRQRALSFSRERFKKEISEAIQQSVHTQGRAHR